MLKKSLAIGLSVVMAAEVLTGCSGGSGTTESILHTRKGLNLCAVGENPGAADAAGVNVTRVKYFNILLGGGVCGIGGGDFS